MRSGIAGNTHTDTPGLPGQKDGNTRIDTRGNKEADNEKTRI